MRNSFIKIFIIVCLAVILIFVNSFADEVVIYTSLDQLIFGTHFKGLPEADRCQSAGDL